MACICLKLSLRIIQLCNWAQYIIKQMIQNSEEASSYEFRLLISKVFLTVKFHCKMHLRYDHEKITDDVSMTNPSQFVFQQEIVLKDTALKGFFEITIHLTTDKGNHIVAGRIKFQSNELIAAQGHAITIALSNCLDSQAKCQLKVLRLRTIRVRKEKNRVRATSGLSSIRSEDSKIFDYFGHRSNITVKDRQKNWRQSQRIIDESNRDEYRQSRLNPLSRQPSQRRKSEYSRQKYKIQFDTIENNLKLDIVKYKLKVDELQKSNEQKLRLIKNLNEELNNIKIKEYRHIYYDEELQNKNKILQTYEGYLKELRRQNEQLRNRKLQLQKSVINLQENHRFDVQRLHAQSQQQRSFLQKEKDQFKQDIKYYQFQLQSRNQKLERLRFMIEEYENKLAYIEEENKAAIKAQKQNHRKNKEIFNNQINCLESALRVEEMAKNQLEDQNKALKSKLKAKQSEILLIFQQISILKSEITHKDEFKLKYAEMHRTNGMAELRILDLADQNKRLRDKISEIEQQKSVIKTQIDILKKELKQQKEKNSNLINQIDKLNSKIAEYETGFNKHSKVQKTFQWEIKYIQDNQKDWKEIMKTKNQKILEITEVIEKMRREHAQEEMKNIKALQAKDEEIARLKQQLRELQREKDDHRCKSLLSPSEPPKKQQLSEEAALSSPPLDKSHQIESAAREQTSAQRQVESLHQEIALRDDRIRKYETYIDKYLDSHLSRNKASGFFQAQLDELNAEIAKKDGVIESLNEFIYERDKQASQLSERPALYPAKGESASEKEEDSLRRELDERERLLWSLTEQLANSEDAVAFYRNSTRELTSLLQEASATMGQSSDSRLRDAAVRVAQKITQMQQRAHENAVKDRQQVSRKALRKQQQDKEQYRAGIENKEEARSESVQRERKVKEDQKGRDQQDSSFSLRYSDGADRKEQYSDEQQRFSSPQLGEKQAQANKLSQQSKHFEVERVLQYTVQSNEPSGLAKHLELSRQLRRKQRQGAVPQEEAVSLEISSRDLPSADFSSCDLLRLLEQKDDIIGRLSDELRLLKLQREQEQRSRSTQLAQELNDRQLRRDVGSRREADPYQNMRTTDRMGLDRAEGFDPRYESKEHKQQAEEIVSSVSESRLRAQHDKEKAKREDSEGHRHELLVSKTYEGRTQVNVSERQDYPQTNRAAFPGNAKEINHTQLENYRQSSEQRQEYPEQSARKESRGVAFTIGNRSQQSEKAHERGGDEVSEIKQIKAVSGTERRDYADGKSREQIVSPAIEERQTQTSKDQGTRRERSYKKEQRNAQGVEGCKEWQEPSREIPQKLVEERIGSNRSGSPSQPENRTEATGNQFAARRIAAVDLNPSREKRPLPNEERPNEAGGQRATVAQLEDAFRDQEKKHSQTRNALARMAKTLALIGQSSNLEGQSAELVQQLIAEVHALQQQPGVRSPEAGGDGLGEARGHRKAGEPAEGVGNSSSEIREPSSSSEVEFFHGHKNNRALLDPADNRPQNIVDLSKQQNTGNFQRIKAEGDAQQERQTKRPQSPSFEVQKMKEKLRLKQDYIDKLNQQIVGLKQEVLRLKQQHSQRQQQHEIGMRSYESVSQLSQQQIEGNNGQTVEKVDNGLRQKQTSQHEILYDLSKQQIQEEPSDDSIKNTSGKLFNQISMKQQGRLDRNIDKIQSEPKEANGRSIDFSNKHSPDTALRKQKRNKKQKRSKDPSGRNSRNIQNQAHQQTIRNLKERNAQLQAQVLAKEIQNIKLIAKFDHSRQDQAYLKDNLQKKLQQNHELKQAIRIYQNLKPSSKSYQGTNSDIFDKEKGTISAQLDESSAQPSKKFEVKDLKHAKNKYSADLSDSNMITEKKSEIMQSRQQTHSIDNCMGLKRVNSRDVQKMQTQTKRHKSKDNYRQANSTIQQDEGMKKFLRQELKEQASGQMKSPFQSSQLHQKASLSKLANKDVCMEYPDHKDAEEVKDASILSKQQILAYYVEQNIKLKNQIQRLQALIKRFNVQEAYNNHSQHIASQYSHSQNEDSTFTATLHRQLKQQNHNHRTKDQDLLRQIQTLKTVNLRLNKRIQLLQLGLKKDLLQDNHNSFGKKRSRRRPQNSQAEVYQKIDSHLQKEIQHQKQPTQYLKDANSSNISFSNQIDQNNLNQEFMMTFGDNNSYLRRNQSDQHAEQLLIKKQIEIYKGIILELQKKLKSLQNHEPKKSQTDKSNNANQMQLLNTQQQNDNKLQNNENKSEPSLSKHTDEIDNLGQKEQYEKGASKIPQRVSKSKMSGQTLGLMSIKDIQNDQKDKQIVVQDAQLQQLQKNLSGQQQQQLAQLIAQQQRTINNLQDYIIVLQNKQQDLLSEIRQLKENTQQRKNEEDFSRVVIGQSESQKQVSGQQSKREPYSLHNLQEQSKLKAQKNIKNQFAKKERIISSNSLDQQLFNKYAPQNVELREAVRSLERRLEDEIHRNKEVSFELEKAQMKNRCLQQASNQDIQSYSALSQRISYFINALYELERQQNEEEKNKLIQEMIQHLKEQATHQYSGSELSDMAAKSAHSNEKGIAEENIARLTNELELKEELISKLKEELKKIKQDQLINDPQRSSIVQNKQVDFQRPFIKNVNNEDNTNRSVIDENASREEQRYIEQKLQEKSKREALQGEMAEVLNQNKALEASNKQMRLQNRQLQQQLQLFNQLANRSEAQIMAQLVQAQKESREKQQELADYDLKLFQIQAELHSVQRELQEYTAKYQQLQEIQHQVEQENKQLRSQLQRAKLRIQQAELELEKQTFNRSHSKIQQQNQQELQDSLEADRSVKLQQITKKKEKQSKNRDIQRDLIERQINNISSNGGKIMVPLVEDSIHRITQSQDVVELQTKLQYYQKQAKRLQKELKNASIALEVFQYNSLHQDNNYPKNNRLCIASNCVTLRLHSSSPQIGLQSPLQSRQFQELQVALQETGDSRSQLILKVQRLSRSCKQAQLQNTLLVAELNQLKATHLIVEQRNRQLTKAVQQSVKENDKLLKLNSDIAALLPGLKPLASNFKKNQEYKQIQSKLKDTHNQIQKRSKAVRGSFSVRTKQKHAENAGQEKQQQIEEQSHIRDIQTLKQQYIQLRKTLELDRQILESYKNADQDFKAKIKKLQSQLIEKDYAIARAQAQIEKTAEENHILKAMVEETLVRQHTKSQQARTFNRQTMWSGQQEVSIQEQIKPEPKRDIPEQTAQYLQVIQKVFFKKKQPPPAQDLRSAPPQLISPSSPPSTSNNQHQSPARLTFKDIDALLSIFAQLKLIIESKGELPTASNGSDTVVLRSRLDIEMMLGWINEFIRDIKQKYSWKCIECQEYLSLISQQFKIKNEYKTLNRQLIKEKAELGMHEAQKIGKIFQLQAENARLKLQIEQIMDDYHKRIQVINNLKDNLSYLSESIRASQEHTEDLKLKSEQYQTKLDTKDKQLKDKENQIANLQNRYRQILNFYTNQLQTTNKQITQQRRKAIEDKESLKEQIHQLRTKVNQLTFDNKKLLKSFDHYREQTEIQRLNMSAMNDNAQNSSILRGEDIETRLRAIQEQRKIMEEEINSRDQKIVELIQENERLKEEINQQEQKHQQKIQAIIKENQIKKIDTNKKILQLEGMIADLSVATQKVAGNTKKYQINIQKMHSEQTIGLKPAHEQPKYSQRLTNKEVKIIETIKKQCEGQGQDKNKQEKKHISQALSPRSRPVGTIQTVTSKVKVDKGAVLGSISPRSVLSPKGAKQKTQQRQEITKIKSGEFKF